MSRVLLLLLVHAHLDNAQDSRVTETSQKQQGLCVLPPYPANGAYSVVNKPDAKPGDGLQAVYVTYSCGHGHALVGSKDVHCINNIWTAEAPSCESEASTSMTNEETAASTVLNNTSSAWSHNGTEVTPQEEKLYSNCIRDGQQGVCRVITDCKSAKRDLAMKKLPQMCFPLFFLLPLVCCYDNALPAATPIPPGAAAVITEKDPVSYDYEYTNNDEPSDGCEPIPARLTSARTGSKAWDKCIEYQNKYVYPCEKRLALGDGKMRMNYCGHDPDELHAGGIIKAGQFPHMVLLGFGNDTQTARWLCGGTIISEKFVMTVGNCFRTIQLSEEVKYIRTAMLKRSDPLDPKRIYRVARILVHPEYRPNEKYNDIGLLESHTEMLLDRLAMPACLPVGDTYNDTRALAIGFGVRLRVGDSLRKVSLNKFSTEDCSDIYVPQRYLHKGFQESSQLCYGDKTEARDTCQGDVGGPLQIANEHVHCMYTIIGIISFTYVCGFVGRPGIYTRVVSYVPWIESVVWPD